MNTLVERNEDGMINMFWGKKISDWVDIYCLLVFRGSVPQSLKDLFAWIPPETPNECMNLAFDLAEARAMKYDTPVQKWIANILTNDRRDYTDVDNAPCKLQIEQ